ncbi:hypothetical protein [Mangrovitalea sediminis]|uniref:hypothetical protein n=1 Tax=Mangrovitalea sediminis TaxID=1982043 RepID=UPI0011789428|nr:hypothetical protein [Mangrovitalea sediminis]
MKIGSFSGGIFSHDKDDIYVEDYKDGQVFPKLSCERDSLISDLLFLLTNGHVVNKRRHIASFKLPDGDYEECVVEFIVDGESKKIPIIDCQIRVSNCCGKVFYCNSSIIYSISKYSYRPVSDFVAAVSESVRRIKGN